MTLSLHAEYLLGYLAGARALAARDVIPFARIDASDGSAQTRALIKALALGVAEGRKGLPVRNASDVRMRVLALLSHDAAGQHTVALTHIPQNDAELVEVLREPRSNQPELPLEHLIHAAVVGGG